MNIQQITKAYNHNLTRKTMDKLKTHEWYKNEVNENNSSFKQFLEDLTAPKRIKDQPYEQDSN